MENAIKSVHGLYVILQTKDLTNNFKNNYNKKNKNNNKNQK